MKKLQNISFKKMINEFFKQLQCLLNSEKYTWSYIYDVSRQPSGVKVLIMGTIGDLYMH